VWRYVTGNRSRRRVIVNGLRRLVDAVREATNPGKVVCDINGFALLIELENSSAMKMRSTELGLTRDPGYHGAPAEGTLRRSFDAISSLKMFCDDVLSISCENEGV
jgi:hypothetical protein